jgi:hypothetical protein
MVAKYKVQHLPAPEQLTVSQVGHVYQLGRHRLVCGPPHYLRRVLGDGRAKLSLTDLLGNVRLSASDPAASNEALSSSPGLFGMAYDALDVMKWVSAPDALACIFTDWHHRSDPLLAAELLGVPVAEFLAWNHEDRVLSTPARSSAELCYVFQAGVGPAITVRKRTAHENARAVARPRAGSRQFGEKPVELFVSIMSSRTKPADLVIEPHVGQPATLIAAETAGRTYAGAGTPFILDTTIRDWERATGDSAHDLTAGYSFGERAHEISKWRADHGK